MQNPQNKLVKILFATNALQGQRDNDFCWTQEGELVTFPLVCDGEEIDDPCGCRRSMKGLQTLKTTTTVQVGYLRGGRPALLRELHAYMERLGWSRLLDKQALEEIVQWDADNLIKVTTIFPVRTVLEIRGDLIVERLYQEGKKI